MFDQVPGTPKYWQQKRYELVAMLEQLGPFQFFFTLSCADKRWIENFVSIFTKEEDVDVNIEVKDGKESEVLINGTP